MSNVRMTAELIGENKSGAAIAEMSADLRGLGAELDRLDGRDLRMSARLDSVDLMADFKEVERTSDRFDGRVMRAQVELDIATFDAGASRMEAQVDWGGGIWPLLESGCRKAPSRRYEPSCADGS